MAALRKRPRLLVAVALALTLAIGVVGGAVATTWGPLNGHAVKAVRVVSSDSVYLVTTPNVWSDVPNMSLTMSVPGGTKALFVITFSAEVTCFSLCYGLVRVLINGSTVVPVETDSPHGYTLTNSDALIGASAQFVAGPMPAGTYTIKVQAQLLNSGTYELGPKTLSVLRSVV